MHDGASLLRSLALAAALLLVGLVVGLGSFSGQALAAITEADGPPPKGGLPTAAQAQQVLKGQEARESAASKALEGMLGGGANQQGGQQGGQQGASPAPAARQTPAARGGKAIYGDIIIHK